MPYSPLARGVLTAKYDSIDKPDPASRAGRGDKRLHQTSFKPEAIALARNLAELAKARGTDAATLALGWVMANRLVTSVLAGPRTLAQWQAYVAGSQRPWSAADESAVSALVAPGHPATPGFSDPQYPILGRPA